MHASQNLVQSCRWLYADDGGCGDSGSILLVYKCSLPTRALNIMLEPERSLNQIPWQQIAADHVLIPATVFLVWICQRMPKQRRNITTLNITLYFYNQMKFHASIFLTHSLFISLTYHHSRTLRNVRIQDLAWNRKAFYPSWWKAHLPWILQSPISYSST